MPLTAGDSRKSARASAQGIPSLPQAAAYPVQLAVGAREHGDLAEGALLFLPPPGEHVQPARHFSDLFCDEDVLREFAPAFGEAHLGTRGQGRAQRPLAIVFGNGAQGAR